MIISWIIHELLLGSFSPKHLAAAMFFTTVVYRNKMKLIYLVTNLKCRILTWYLLAGHAILCCRLIPSNSFSPVLIFKSLLFLSQFTILTNFHECVNDTTHTKSSASKAPFTRKRSWCSSRKRVGIRMRFYSVYMTTTARCSLFFLYYIYNA